ncbi:unnamed protein product [Protopolystoma xenopodis]|uniref:Uncharacterized protein n=1 Tax=Protopolystoma xenopodis TaxID=117903 RepID=A0A448WXW2_9PLAT|nr:unnamed protein product [Protopolystoma xenopodis]
MTLPLPQPTFLSSQSLQLQPRPQPSRPVTILAVAMLSGQLDVYRLDEPDLPFISLLPPHDESASLLPSSSPSKSSIPNAPLYLIRLASLQVHSSQGVNPTSSVLISSNLETNLIDVPHAKQSMIEDSEKGNAENSEVFDSTLMRTSDCTGDQRKLANERQDAVLYPSKEKTEKKNPIVSGLPATARSVLSVLQASSPTERPSGIATVLPTSAAHTVPLPACIVKRRQVSFQPLENPISGRLDLTWAPASMRWPERTSPDVLPIPSPLPLPRTSIIKCDESEPLESKKDPLREEESDDREANESASSFACIVRANRRNASFGCYLDLSSLSHSSCPLEEIDECASSNHPANLPTTPALGNTLTTACTPFAAPPVCGIEGSMV